MQDLIQQEKFELEVLDRLNSKKLLAKLVFGGDSMLRLCHGLNRFSVDLDFWVVKDINRAEYFKQLRQYLGSLYTVRDCANKFYTMLFEIRCKEYSRSLKLEIRKERKQVDVEQSIAYSKYADIQVLVPTVGLEGMMRAKIEAFIDRKEARDAFDIEFLLRRGVGLKANKNELGLVLKVLSMLTKSDFSVKLGPLLEETERKYYLAQRFKLLEAEAKAGLGIIGIKK
ncbi:MAG: nucleotidyl transferase AbiEii/AbiGii toxin family protein [Candidatus Omnitrophota bacterium]